MGEETTLEEYVARRLERCGRGCSEHKVLLEVYKEVREGSVSLKDPSPPPTLADYLRRLDYSLWFWTVLALVASTLASVAGTGAVPFIQYVRYVLGSLYVLFLPGYVTVEALYPRRGELSPLERLALSIGLSLAIVPLVGLALNYTPAGITLSSTLTAVSLYILAVSVVAAKRKHDVVRRASTY